MPDSTLVFRRYTGRHGAAAPVYWLGTLGLWGCVDVGSGVIVDPLHPHKGLCLAGAVCLIDETKGSTAGPGALLEWLGGPHPPAALLARQSNLSIAIAAEAAHVLGLSGSVLGELIHTYAESDLEAWHGATGILRGDRLQRTSQG